MKRYFCVDPLYVDRFANVWRWSEWAETQPDFTGQDTGVDLVAEERAGGYCAIQCKLHAPATRIGKPALDSFISAAARDPFTQRMVVDTGAEWGLNAHKTLRGLTPACQVRFNASLRRQVERLRGDYRRLAGDYEKLAADYGRIVKVLSGRWD